MKTWNDIYIINKDLDQIFYAKFSEDNEIYEKNCIEFLVELGEFVNETKCFKYWSIKKAEYDKLLEELADVFTMLMTFYNFANEDFKVPLILKKDKNLLLLINETYYLGTKLYKELSEKLLNDILTNLLLIARLLNISEKEIIEAIEKKQFILYERLNDKNY